jgi:hypothetical protein
MIAPAMLSSPERNGATVHLKDRQVNSPPGALGLHRLGGALESARGLAGI